MLHNDFLHCSVGTADGVPCPRPARLWNLLKPLALCDLHAIAFYSEHKADIRKEIVAGRIEIDENVRDLLYTAYEADLTAARLEGAGQAAAIDALLGILSEPPEVREIAMEVISAVKDTTIRAAIDALPIDQREVLMAHSPGVIEAIGTAARNRPRRPYRHRKPSAGERDPSLGPA